MTGLSQRPVPTQHNKRKKQISVSPAGFEPAISAIEGPHTYASDGTATGLGPLVSVHVKILNLHIIDINSTMEFVFVPYSEPGHLKSAGLHAV